MNEQTAVYRFEEYVLDLSRGALSRAGQDIPLRRRSFDLLRLMIENPGRLLDRDTINAAVWPDTVTTDENIAQCVREVRRAIGDHARSVIRTVPRRGFLFTAAVGRFEPPMVARAPRARTRAPGPTIAVPPFKGIDSGIAASGLAEELAREVKAALSRLTAMTVLETPVQPSSDGHDARYLLTGGVRRSSDQLNVTVQLIDRATFVHLWAGHFDLPGVGPGDPLDSLAPRIATGVARHIEVRERARSLLARTPDPTPHELIARGREILLKAPRDQLGVARALFTQASELDPCYAPAHAELAYAFYDELTWWFRPDTRDFVFGEGFDRAERALALNSSLPAANRALAVMHLRAREHADALRWARHAVALSPYDPASHAVLANILSFIGRSDEALRHLVKAQMLEPVYPPVWDYYTGRALVHVGRHEEAVIWLKRASRRAPHIKTWGGYRAAALAHLGRFDEIQDALADLKLPRGEPSISLMLAHDSYLEGSELDILTDGLAMAGFPG